MTTDVMRLFDEQLPVISDELMRAQLATTAPYTVRLLRATDRLVRPEVDGIIWEHGRRNFALRECGVMPIVLPATDDSDWAGIAVFTVPPEEVVQIMAADPGVAADIFTYEVHPVRGFRGSALPV